VVVRRGVSVEPHTGQIGALGEQPFGGQHPEVPVDGGQAHAGQSSPHLLVHRRRRGVGVAGAHGLEDDLARTGEPLAACPCQAREGIA
jgi:hypothetical protein